MQFHDSTNETVGSTKLYLIPSTENPHNLIGFKAPVTLPVTYSKLR